MTFLRFSFFFFASLIICCQSIDTQFTVMDELLKSQAELSLTHEFTQSVFLWHRERIVPVLSELSKYSIDKYFDGIDEIKLIARNTREQIEEFPLSQCSENSLNNWDLQVRSFGNRINFCLSEATRILNGEYHDLNYFDADGSRVSNQVQNQGLDILSTKEKIHLNRNIHQVINQRLRDLLLAASPWVVIMDELFELMEHHIERAKAGTDICVNQMVTQFEGISANALENVSHCPNI
ncbi:CLUMA_CG006772, isoform A [Clunio marinus]|uniref:CLUMA_CG006772, isoform A n=1 Tax=Clunio marinus TaxID=568069 RepID=A0A1J1I0X0_9DIPT|nr:CLUMA_CG006772, isoform A [Clunio marinus]